MALCQAKQEIPNMRHLLGMHYMGIDLRKLFMYISVHDAKGRGILNCRILCDEDVIRREFARMPNM